MPEEIGTEAPVNDPMTTVQSLNTLANEIADLRDEEAKASLVKKDVADRLEAKEIQMREALEANGITEFASPRGKFYIAYRSSVKVPRTPEELAALTAYLQSQGAYDLVFKPNSQSLNSFVKEEFEKAKRDGRDDFVVPGCGEMTLTPILNFRRK